MAALNSTASFSPVSESRGSTDGESALPKLYSLMVSCPSCSELSAVTGFESLVDGVAITLWFNSGFKTSKLSAEHASCGDAM